MTIYFNMNNDRIRRIRRDFREFDEGMRDQTLPFGVMASPRGDDMDHWDAVIFGPENTPFEGGVFKLVIDFPKQYPSQHLDMKFITPVYHPNIYTNGNICIDILQKNWSSIMTPLYVLAAVQSLLNDPNIDSPANSEAARLYATDRAEYYRKVRECVEKSWTLVEGDAEAVEEGEYEYEYEDA